MSERYIVPAGQHRVEEEITRSRFITTLAYTPTVEAAPTSNTPVTCSTPTVALKLI